MKVRFVMRAPGDHHEVGFETMDSVPRAGETVSLDGERTHVVHSVEWDIPSRTVNVMLEQ